MPYQETIEPYDAYRFDQLSPPQYPLAKKFYKSARYPSNIGREDEVYVLRYQLNIVAALKLVKLDQYLILRSMVVSPQHRRSGLGLLVLQNLAQRLNTRTCWCYPFADLETFYAAIGFKRCQPENSPKIIQQKYQQYFSQGKSIIIMKRD